MGFRSASIPISMPIQPYNDPTYEPFWSAMGDMGVPLALHVFTDGPSGDDAPTEVKTFPTRAKTLPVRLLRWLRP